MSVIFNQSISQSMMDTPLLFRSSDYYRRCEEVHITSLLLGKLTGYV